MKIGPIDLGNQPILLAPMEDVTGPAFRLMCQKSSEPTWYILEFVSADALIRAVSENSSKVEYSDETASGHSDLRKGHTNRGGSRPRL